MKIGIVCYPTFGGSGIVATELGKALADKGHEVHFIAYRQPVRLSNSLNNVYFHEVRVAEDPLFEYPPYELGLACKLFDVVKFEKLDLLHVHYAIPHAYVAYLAKQMLAEYGIEIPVVTTLHGTDITLVGKSPGLAPAVSFSINHSDVVTAVSEDLKKETLASFSIRKKVNVIPNFIDFSIHQANFSKELHSHFAPKGEKILVHISNFRPVKRVAEVIQIFAKILGKSNDVSRILAVSDLFILPSEKESFGLVALEAMAAKVPVISSNAGGLSEVNINGETGYTSDVGDVDKMATDAINLLSDEKLYEQFSAKAYKVAKTFDIKNVLPLYEAMYKKALR